MAILSLFVVYAAAANIFLSTSLFERVVNGEPETILIRFERGWTIFPGRVHAKNLSIRSRDSAVDFELRLENVTFDVSLVNLVRQKFVITKARGTGVTARARQKVESPAATADYVAALPPIEGIGPLSIRPPGPPDPDRWSDSAWKLWTIDLSDILAEDVREIWIDHVRFTGTAKIGGAFYLKPIRRVHLQQIHADDVHGKIEVAGRPVLEPVAGSLAVDVNPFDPRFVPLARLIDYMRARVTLEGSCPDLGNLAKAIKGDSDLHGALTFARSDVRLADGALAAGTSLHLALTDGSASVVPYRISSDAAVEAAVTADGNHGHMTFAVDLAKTQLHDLEGVKGDRDPIATAPNIRIAGEARDLVLAHGFPDLNGTLDFQLLRLPNVHALDRYVPHDAEFGFVAGRADVEGHLRADRARHVVGGNGKLRADALDVHVAKARVRGNAAVEADFESFDWEAKRMENGRVIAHVSTAAIASEKNAAQPMVNVRDLSVDARSKLIDVDDPLRDLSIALRLGDASLADPRLLAAYLPKGDEMRIEVGHAPVQATADVVIKDHRAAGTMDARSSRLSFSFGQFRLRTDVTVSAKVDGWDWTRGDLSLLDGRLSMNRVRIVPRAGATENDASLLDMDGVIVSATSKRFTFSDPLQSLNATFVARGRVREAAAINAFLPAGTDFALDGTEGVFEAKLRGRVASRVADVDATFKSRGLGVAGEKVSVRGNVDVSAAITRWKLDENRLAIRQSRAVIDDVDIGLRRDSRGDVRAKRLALEYANDDFDLTHPSISGGSGHLVVDDATLPDARSLNAVLKSSVVSLQAGRARAAIDVAFGHGKQSNGGVSVSVDDATVKIQQTLFAGGIRIDVPLRGFDADRTEVDISGARAAFRDVRVVGGPAETKNWTADVLVIRGTVGRGSKLEAQVVADAADASPFLALVLGKNVPGFIADLVRAPELHAESGFTFDGNRVAVRDLVAKGGDMSITGSCTVFGDRSRGGFIVQKGPISAGLGIGQDSGLRLFNNGPWLAEKKRAATALLAEPRIEKRDPVDDERGSRHEKAAKK